MKKAAFRLLISLHFHALGGKKAYHRENGREATACHDLRQPASQAYHRENGREATAAEVVVGRAVYSLPQGKR